MANALVEKIRQARQINVTVGKWTFTVSRPTDLQMSEMKGKKITQRELLSSFVVGWEGVLENDLYSGGTSDEVIFDKDVYEEFISDHPETWNTIVTAIIEGYKTHEQKVADSLKN